MNSTREESKQAEYRKVAALIERAQKAETLRNMDDLGTALSPIWNDTDVDPDISGADEKQKPEILRLCGFYLGYYGHLKNIAEYQERGKDLLTSSIDLFEQLGLECEAAKARLSLAWRYNQQGSLAEAEAILEYTAGQMPENCDRSLALDVRLASCVVSIGQGDLETAKACLEKLEPEMVRGTENGLRARFHIEAGILYTDIGDLDRAEYHYGEAFPLSEKNNNKRLTAIVLGNLAFVLKEKGELVRAHEQIDKAIDLNTASEQEGFLAHNFDTKALIYFEEGEYGRAMVAIERALQLFSKGEDYAGLADAQFNKVKILLRLQETIEAAVQFGELVGLARIRLGEAAARRYAGLFVNCVFVPAGEGFKEDVAGFKKFILSNALNRSGLVMKGAAEELGISQANLSDILRRQFPELFSELGIKKRKSRKR